MVLYDSWNTGAGIGWIGTKSYYLREKVGRMGRAKVISKRRCAHA